MAKISASLRPQPRLRNAPMPPPGHAKDEQRGEGSGRSAAALIHRHGNNCRQRISEEESPPYLLSQKCLYFSSRVTSRTTSFFGGQAFGQIGILGAQSALVGAGKILIQACLVISRRQGGDLLLLSIVVQERGGGWDRGRWRASGCRKVA